AGAARHPPPLPGVRDSVGQPRLRLHGASTRHGPPRGPRPRHGPPVVARQPPTTRAAL
ncbi:MAG: hypothetical protein AVDCRST_MAG88-2965, partial [uncultured Thermomicrobiales bacterium]